MTLEEIENAINTIKNVKKVLGGSGVLTLDTALLKLQGLQIGDPNPTKISDINPEESVKEPTTTKKKKKGLAPRKIDPEEISGTLSEQLKDQKSIDNALSDDEYFS